MKSSKIETKLTRNQKTFGGRAVPGPAGEGYMLQKNPKLDFLGGRGGERRGRRGTRGGKGVGGKGKGAATAILQEGRHVASTALRESIA